MQPSALTSEDWLDAALVDLQQNGYAALRALPLAKKLNVTRGSFYHHFDSLDDFHAAVIAHWSKQSSDQVIEAALAAGDPRQALDDLLQTTLRSGEALERAIRSWSTVHPLVATEVEGVDETRIGTAATLLSRSGIPPARAAARAKLLYWAAIGRLMLPFPEHNLLSRAEISEIANLMLSD